MATLNATQKLDLIYQVVWDQYGADLQKIQKEYQLTTQQIAKDKGKGMYEKLAKVIAPFADEPGQESKAIQYTTRAYVRENSKSHKAINLTVSANVKSMKTKIFEINDIVPISPEVYFNNGSGLYLYADKQPELAGFVERAKPIIAEIRAFVDDLEAIICSVRSTKKLCELTNIFTPFLSTSVKAESTALVAADVLCRVNERKSPKSRTSAAA